MRVCIAGPRDFKDYNLLCKAIEESGFKITEVVSGGAAGADSLGERWADENNIPKKVFEAKWKDLKAKGAVIKAGQYGKYNANAGPDRNEKMAEYAEACIAINLGTNGTSDMLKRAKAHNLEVFEWKPPAKADNEFEYLF